MEDILRTASMFVLPLLALIPWSDEVHTLASRPERKP